MYRPLVIGKVYFSRFNVVPLLLLVSTFVNVVPSLEIEMSKFFCLSLPLYHAIFTLQMFLPVPKSTCIHEPFPKLDHLVLRLLSSTFDGGKLVWLPDALGLLIVAAVH